MAQTIPVNDPGYLHRSGQVLMRPDAARHAYRPCVRTMRDPYGEHSRGAAPESTH